MAGTETHLKSLVTRRSNIDRDIEREVQRLRVINGYSWTQIGALLGVSKQAAQQRYGRVEHDGPCVDGTWPAAGVHARGCVHR